MFLEDTQIDLPYSCHAMTRSWLVHGFADQGARLYVGDTLASPSTLFQIDHHADHTHPESGARVGNLAHCAFSSAISGNARIFGGNPLIWNYQNTWLPAFAVGVRLVGAACNVYAPYGLHDLFAMHIRPN